jgi:Uma2 family endonuclease
MSSAAAERTPTFEELYRAIEALPPGLTGEILQPGVIRTMGRPGGPHRITAWTIRRALANHDRWEGGHGWWLEPEAELRLLQERLAVPDLSGWCLDPDDEVPPAFAFENPIVRRPDWCCEVLSPSTETIDREVKVPLYSAAGIEWIWLVDPSARRIEILRVRDHRAEPLETIEGAVQRPILPFDSIIDTSRWWASPPGGAG